MSRARSRAPRGARGKTGLRAFGLGLGLTAAAFVVAKEEQGEKIVVGLGRAGRVVGECAVEYGESSLVVDGAAKTAAGETTAVPFVVLSFAVIALAVVALAVLALAVLILALVEGRE